MLVDLDNDGALDAVELLAIEDDRFGNAAGFSGKGTRGLLNVNTAGVEVLRTLPHMSRMVWNDNPSWPGTNTGADWDWQGLPVTAQIAGDVQSNGSPRGIASRNPQWVRVPESIIRYREGGGLYDAYGFLEERWFPRVLHVGGGKGVVGDRVR